MAEKVSKITAREVLRMVFRRRLAFLGAASVFALVVLVGANWYPLKYTGVARFERRSDPASENITAGKSESFEAIKRTLPQELTGQDALGATADELEKLGLLSPFSRDKDGRLTAEGTRGRQELIQRLQADVKVIFEVSSPEVDRISVAFTDRDPRLAQELPNTLVKRHISLITERIVTNLTASRDFLRSKVSDAEKSLADWTKKRLDFETKYAGMHPESPGALQEQVRRLLTEMDAVRRQEITARQKLERYKVLLGEPPDAGAKDTPPAGEAGTADPSADGAPSSEQQPSQVIKVPNPELARLRSELRDYKRKLDEARVLANMTDNHPTVKALRRKVEDLEKEVAEAPETVVREEVFSAVSPDDEQARREILRREEDLRLQRAILAMDQAAASSELEVAAAELQRLQARLDDFQRLALGLGPVRQEYLEISKQVQDQQAEMDRWQKRLTDVEMALAAEAAKRRTHLSAVELAQKQYQPSSPKLLYVVAAGIVGGLLFGAGLVLLFNTMDRSVSSSEDAEQTFGLPVFSVIGEIVTPRERIRRKVKAWVLGPVFSLIMLAALGLAVLNITLYLNYRDPQYEQWRQAPLAYLRERADDVVQTLKGRL